MNFKLSVRERTYRATESRHARDSLIVKNLGFVKGILAKTIVGLPDHVDRENLEAAGVLGLVEAAENFDPSRGAEFKSFAYLRIRGAILDELRRNSPLPQRMIQLIAQVQKVIDESEHSLSPEELAERSGLTLDEVESVLEAMRLRQVHSRDDDGGWMNQLVDSRHEQPDQIATQRDATKMLAQCIEELPKKERIVITLYYLEDLRLREIGEVLNLSESRISRLLSKAEYRLSTIFAKRNEASA